jgi:membrane-bound lytic murein transglycosylase D
LAERPVRAALAAAILVLSLSGPARGQSAPARPGPPADSVAAALLRPDVAAARTWYEEAWADRRDGAFENAVARADSALAIVAAALGADPDASTRRELVDLQSRATALREAALREAREPREARPAPDPPPAGEADETVLNAPALEDITPQFNDDVYRYIDFFTGAGRSTFERWLKRSGRYMAMFRDVLRKEGLPPDLVHLVFVESGFNVHARSYAAAVGPWQFLRGTAKLFGLTVDQWVDERRDPEKSTVAAARYLKHLYSIFGDWPLALASYNAGEGTVLRAIKRQGTTNYWDLRLPRQTEDYVPQFMAVLAISRDPRKYGFDDVQLDDPLEFDEIALRGAVDLRAIARLADCTVEDLRELNPAVLRHAARGREGVTTLRVPPGKGEALMERLRDGAPLPAVDLTLRHKVRRGETLAGIARQYAVDAGRLAAKNGIGRSRPLRRGQTLVIPATMRSPTPEVLDPAADPRASTGYVPPRVIGPPARIDGESTAEGRATITVRRGETLATIAARHGVSVEDIRRWNNLRTTTVRGGTRLKIRTGEGAALAEAGAAADSARIAELKPPPAKSRARAGAGRGVHVVREGQTHSGIARQHGVSVQALKRANGLRGDQVRAGQRLRLPA